MWSEDRFLNTGPDPPVTDDWPESWPQTLSFGDTSELLCPNCDESSSEPVCPICCTPIRFE